MNVALIGNQNSGKTTLFNALTGMNQKVGNWPGVTIEKKEGIIEGTRCTLIDLPGIYSLAPYTIEEKIAIDFLLNEKPEVVINVVDATNLERSLYLTTQLLELDCKVIIALNMIDLADKRGIYIDDKLIELQLGAELCKISAQNKTGIKNLINHINSRKETNNINIFDEAIEEKINLIEKKYLSNMRNQKFIAIKILENDISSNEKQILQIRKELEDMYKMDINELIATNRYTFLDGIINTAVKKKKANKVNKLLDNIFLNKYLAFPIFIIILLGVYYFSVGVIGKSMSEFVSQIVIGIKSSLYDFFAEKEVYAWLSSLVIDGIIDGVGTILTFVPQLVMLFLSISILETSGYMPRISFVLDKPLRKIGLSGKSLICFIVGSGCSVPGILASRIIEEKEERKRTIMLTPFIPCSAKLPIIILFSNYFFKSNSSIVVLSMYLLSIVIIIFSAFLMNKTNSKNQKYGYVFELPEYKIPNAKYVWRDVYERTLAFVKRAGSIILLCSTVVWILSSFSMNLKYGVDIDNSILAQIGKKLSWIFYPVLGVKSWGATVSIFQGLIAKEQVISSMSIIAGLSNKNINASKIFEAGGIFDFFDTSTAFAFVVFNLFSVPCISTISAMKKELGGTKELIRHLIVSNINCIHYSVNFKKCDRECTMNFLIIGIILFCIYKSTKHIRNDNQKGCSMNCQGCVGHLYTNRKSLDILRKIKNVLGKNSVLCQNNLRAGDIKKNTNINSYTTYGELKSSLILL